MEVYLDNASTMPVRPEVIEAMRPYWTERYGNPSSLHGQGLEAKKAIAEARQIIAGEIGCHPNEIVFTSGGTEGDNLAVKGFAFANRAKGNHIITTATEHHAVLESLRWLKEFGFEVTVLDTDRNGVVTPDRVERAIRPNTILAAIQYANNEIGTIQPIADIGNCLEAHNIALFTDAVQAVGHRPISVSENHITMMSAAAHKFGGVKGTGFLYVREGTALTPILHGGPQEMKLRAGTENVPGIVGMATALVCSNRDAAERTARIAQLRDRLQAGICNGLDEVLVNAGEAERLPGTLNVSVKGVEAASVLVYLDLAGICSSGGSACTSASGEVSHVLQAIGVPEEYIRGSVRFTVSDAVQDEEIDRVIRVFVDTVHQLRR